MNKNEKLLFPLCLKCATLNEQECNHDEPEREFVGTWSTVEVNKALEKGYVVREIYEVWNFEKSTELWRGYVEDFMKIKLETSPHNFATKEEYARDIEEKMGIKLDINKIAENPGKRAVAKLCLNSLWGKFGQRQNMASTEFINDPCRFYEVLLDDRLADLNVFYISDSMIQVNYRHKEYYVKNNRDTNIFIAVYTTANARLRLYDQLSKLDKAALYCDTDSILYLDDGTNTVKTGDCLGEWTDELGGSYITKFLTTGPKSYYYRTNTGKECTKVKGFRLHHKNAMKINGEAMEKLIDGEISNLVTENTSIKRDVQTKKLLTVQETKTFSFDFDKRAIGAEYFTYPYGFTIND